MIISLFDVQVSVHYIRNPCLKKLLVTERLILQTFKFSFFFQVNRLRVRKSTRIKMHCFMGSYFANPVNEPLPWFLQLSLYITDVVKQTDVVPVHSPATCTQYTLCM